MPKEQRNKGKRKVNPAPKPQRLDMPVFNYISACCGLKAQKPALVKTADAEGTLGSWRCGGCGKSAKVSRIKNEIKQEVSA